MRIANSRYTILIVIVVASIGFHIHRRGKADFYYTDGKIEVKQYWHFNEERYELLADGFRVEKGNFLYYTEEFFETGYYIHKFRILGLPVKFRKVDYAHNYCWGFPGIPGVEWFKNWPSKGKERFSTCLPIVELYRHQQSK